MAAKIRLADGRDITVMLSGKRVAEALAKANKDSEMYVRFSSAMKTPIWINPALVAAVEDRPDMD